MRRLFLMVTLFASVLTVMGQAKKPTLMIVPADAWCTENGYIQQFDMQGKSTTVSDYEKAVRENGSLLNVITKIGEIMTDRGFPLKDLGATLRNISQSTAEDEMTTSNKSGSALAETPLERLLNRAKADILVELYWKVNTTGPKNSITFNLRGLDAYTNKQVAAAQGNGAPSFSVDVPVLLEEAVLEHMDGFVSQLQSHFDDLLANGREVVVNVRWFDDGSGASFENEYDGEELADIIDNWMAANTEGHRYNLSDATDNVMRFEQVRIPLFRSNGSAMDTRSFVNELRRKLSQAPYNIKGKLITKGLGRVDLVLEPK